MRSLTEGLESDAKAAPRSDSGGGFRDKLNELASGPAGMILLVVIVLAIGWFVFSRLQTATGPAPGTVMDPRVRIMNPLTGDMDWYVVRLGSKMPEGFHPVEYCWEDHPDDLAVPVVLNTRLFPPDDPRRDEPTICPCGDDVVVPRNPKPEEFLGLQPKDHETDRAPDCVVEHYQAYLN